MQKELNNIKMSSTWLSYLAGAHGVLEAAGLWQGEVYELAGLTGLAFHFIVHETACPSSVTVYDWSQLHFNAMDRIGVYTTGLSQLNYSGLNTYEQLKQDALARIKQAIDKGRGVVTWAPTPVLEFGIIKGYDDEDKVLAVVDCCNGNPDPLLYENLGRSEVPILYLQTFEAKVAVDAEKMYRTSLRYGLEHWQERHFDPRYACGQKAYDNLQNTLTKQNYNPFGLSYLIHVYADTKALLARYLQELAAKTRDLTGLDKAAGLYQQVAAAFAGMKAIAPFEGPGKATVDAGRLPELLATVKDCRQWESAAMEQIARSLDAH